jgi:hypothetical protein
VPSDDPPPLRPWVIPLIIFGFNVVFLTFLGARGVLEKLPQAAQFYFGTATFALPMILYAILRKRSERND